MTVAMEASPREKVLSALAAALIVTLMGYLLLIGLPTNLPIRHDPPPVVLTLQPPLAAEHPPKPLVERPRPSHASPRPSPSNLRKVATPIVAPPPPVPLPNVSPVVATLAPGEGVAPSAGASDRSGPGVGAGGEGKDLGGGGNGQDDGDVPPRLVKGRIKAADLPPDLRDIPVEGTVSVRYDIDPEGRIGDCAVVRSSGLPELDQLTCRLIQQRFRYAPARTPDGEPIASTIEEDHHWSNEGASRPD